MLVKRLREITNEKLNVNLSKELSQLKIECENICIKAAGKGESSQQFIVDYKSELDEVIRQFEEWMLDEGLTFMKDQSIITAASNEIIYQITWKLGQKDKK